MDGLGKGPALPNGDNISLLNSEAWGAVGHDVPVPLLVPVVLLDVVQVVPSDDNSVPHFVGNDHGPQDLAPDADISSEGAFFVDVVALDGLLGGFEPKADVPVVPHSLGLLVVLFDQQLLVVLEDSSLFLISKFLLFNHFV